MEHLTVDEAAHSFSRLKRKVHEVAKAAPRSKQTKTPPEREEASSDSRSVAISTPHVSRGKASDPVGEGPQSVKDQAADPSHGNEGRH